MKARVGVGLAMFACVAACTLPLLVTGGLVAGLGALFTDSKLLGPLVLGVTGVAALMWWQRRRAAATRTAAGSCGCGGGC